MSKGRWAVNKRFLIGAQGNPMMERWRLIQTPWFGIYVHFIYREDIDPIPHDHPWTFWRLVVRGGYRERYWTDPSKSDHDRVRWHRRGALSRFPTEHGHWIDTVLPGTTSLVIVGRKCRVWGFWKAVENPSTYGDLMAAAMGASIEVRPERQWIAYHNALGERPNEGVTS